MKRTLLDEELFRIFVHPGEVVEIRMLNAYKNSKAWEGYSKGVVSGYFDDHGEFCNAVQSANKSFHGGIYFTLHVIDPRLIGRACNRLKASDLTTSDLDVIAYRWLPIDIDPVRPSGISSSESELRSALTLRDQIADEICKEYQLEDPIYANSGNGAHLLYPLPDLPACKYAEAIKGMLLDISAKYSTDKVLIDTKVFNPARIWKVYGTKARKGDALPARNGNEARPHRTSYIESIPLGIRP